MQFVIEYLKNEHLQKATRKTEQLAIKIWRCSSKNV